MNRLPSPFDFLRDGVAGITAGSFVKETGACVLAAELGEPLRLTQYLSADLEVLEVIEPFGATGEDIQFAATEANCMALPRRSQLHFVYSDQETRGTVLFRWDTGSDSIPPSFLLSFTADSATFVGSFDTSPFFFDPNAVGCGQVTL